jgi:class 3 adenylate cyclase
MTSFSLSQETQWPFYTHVDYEVFGQSFLSNSGAQYVSWSPIVVGGETRDAWGQYAVENDAWVEEGLEWRAVNEGIEMPEGPFDVPATIYRRDASAEPVPESGTGPFAPVWQMAGAPTDPSVVNFNLLSDNVFDRTFEAVQSSKAQALSEFVDATGLYGSSAATDKDNKTPQSLLMTPLFSDFESNDNNLVGNVVSVLPWDIFFKDVIQEGVPSLYVVVSDGACGNDFTFEVRGPEVTFLGQGDLHDTHYSEYQATSDFATTATAHHGECAFSITVYPSDQLWNDFHQTNDPVFWAVFVGLIFVLFGIVFFIYDLFVQKRTCAATTAAAKSNEIVSSLFPAEIRDRLFGNDGKKVNKNSDSPELPESKYRLKDYLKDEEENEAKKSISSDSDSEEGDKKILTPNDTGADMYDTKPIADLFPNTTVMFADIAGFTAWSSVREPSQVFTLLETVYRAFDMSAKRRRVFKVETVGDCYVAVAGLPEPRKDHAVVMAKFARECVEHFNGLAKQLEITLGPDTADLAMRAGLHSGPVTAGVLRGDRSRFQLFGDTVNTAARIEGTGMRDRVHLSGDTAQLLIDAGKDNWVRKRAELVSSKGKGVMQTYWLQTPGQANKQEEEEKEDRAQQGTKLKDVALDDLEEALPPKVKRLVSWNVEILKKLLQHIIAKRNAMGNKQNYDKQLTKMEAEYCRRQYCLDEVTELIPLSKFDIKAHRNQELPSKIVIPEKVEQELRLFVASVAAMHRDNPFHNFEHASHVTMSVSKLLARIVAPDKLMKQDETEASSMAASLHDHTYGITSDPLTQFGCVLSALIHDTDHSGVSNFQLIKENHGIAKFFKKKSVAEQNSIVLAWEKLMHPRFSELRRCIYSEPSELDRFRQLVINNVLATDIFDKELQTLRRNRWDKAFQRFHTQSQATNPEDDVNRKATIVMEHLIQASDVAHTMQHWHIYSKWNERLFAEMTLAYRNGRMEKDPAPTWYQGELGFLDNYIIPLAKKLKECGVFGVSSDEYLNYALENRREWASKGEEVVAKYVETYSKNEEKEEEPTVTAAADNGKSADSKGE